MPMGLRSDLRTIFACLSRARRRDFGLLILLMPVTALAEALTVAAIVPVIALLSGQPVQPPLDSAVLLFTGNGAVSPLPAAALMFASVVTLTAALRLALSWLNRHFAFALGHEISVEMQRRLLSQPYAFHLRRRSSEHLAALDKVDLLVFDLAIQGIQALSAILVGACILALLVAIDPLNATLAMLVLCGFYAIALAATRKRLRQHGNIINAAYEQRTKFVQESIGGIRDLILDHSQEAALARFRAVDAAFAQARTKTAFLAAAPRFLIEAAGLMVIAMLAIVIAGQSGGITTALPFLSALALGAMRLMPLMSQLYAAWAGAAVVEPALADVAAALRLPLPDGKVPDPIKFQRSIEFDGVCFNYPDRTHRAVEDIQLKITKGARVAITGRTGSGKSTLADLLMGLLEPSAGSILIDGVKLSPEQLPGWRRSIAHVPQQIFLADDSIAANIALSFQGGEEDRDRVESAARQAQLHEFIESLRDGYETRVGERGVRISGGQRQRLALARALYKATPILVLDEPTSALDEQTEKAIMEATNDLQASGVTIVVIAHRPSTMIMCDPIYVLDEGRLLKFGGFSELFGSPQGIDKAG